MSGKMLSIRLLTEDSAKSAVDVLQHLARHIVQLLVPSTRTDLIQFQPLEDEDARRARRANGWKEKNQQRRENVILRREIATDLMRENAFVFFHYDGDRAWADRDSSENVAKFQRLILDGVRMILHDALVTKGLDASNVAVAARLSRLFQIVPFYSIEAWLFQSTAEAIRLCREEHQGEHVPWHEQWAEQPAAIDEAFKPKEACKLKTDSYASLARAFPATDVYLLDASFTSTMEPLFNSAELRHFLEQIRDAGWP
jgi:hypothetical protein